MTEPPTKSPATTSLYDLKPDDAVSDSTLKEYQQTIGGVLHLSNGTHPHLTHTNNQLCKFMHAPSEDCLKAARRVLQFIKSDPDCGIEFSSSSPAVKPDFSRFDAAKSVHVPLTGAVDSDWRSPRSTTGYIFMLANGPISWFSQTQRTSALSTSEAEWIAASSATREAVYLRDIAKFIGITQHSATEIDEDNSGCVQWSKELSHHGKRKHIDLSTFFINDLVEADVIKLKQVPTGQNIADAFTKVLKTSTECKNKYQLFSTYRKARHFTFI